jgi:polyhydroxyalkanoate synthesis regulator phasin
MAKNSLKWLALLGGVALGTASMAVAQDSGALLDVLVKKGVITDQEAEDIRVDLVKDSPIVVLPGAKAVNAITLKGRIQSQFVSLATDIDNTAADPAAVQHFFLRRVYLGVKAKLAGDFTANINYDFAGSTFDEAFIRWDGNEWLSTDIGFRKAPIGLEEWGTSSGKLKSIERSPITRYMVEGNNGRRLGAGSYRQGVYVGRDAKSGFTYTAAITNAERDESATGASGTGSSANNSMAYWLNAGYAGKVGSSAYKVGASYGMLPDQGGQSSTNLGKGFDLDVYSVYGSLDVGSFSLIAEYWGSNVDRGAIKANTDASPSGFYIQPSYKFTDTLEGVVRYTYVDSDGRGVSLSDGVRSAASGGTMDKMEEWYVGGNWYIKGDDVKFQVGYIFAESKDNATTGASGPKANAQGLRAQMQVQF